MALYQQRLWLRVPHYSKAITRSFHFTRCVLQSGFEQHGEVQELPISWDPKASVFKVETMSYSFEKPEFTTGNGVHYIVCDYSWFRAALYRLRDESLQWHEQKQLIDKMIKEVTVHAELEEQYLWKVLPKTGEKGVQSLNKVLDLEQQLRELFSHIEKNWDNQKEVLKTWYKSDDLLMTDMIEEENVSFPNLETSLNANKLAKLEEQMKRARGFEPTHPHLWVPIKFGNKINKLQGIINSAKDKATGRKV